jgi:phage terminase large subunit-like protein
MTMTASAVCDAEAGEFGEMEHTGVERLNAYVSGVLAGSVLAPQTIKQACARHESDFLNPGIYFDEGAANNAIRAIEQFTHAKGRWQGQKIRLEPWQCFWVGSLFGWKWTDTEKRRYRHAYIKVPRKNGKSLIDILIGLLMFAVDREPGAEVYLGATTKEDALNLLFKPTKFIASKSTSFLTRFGVEVSASALTIPANMSTLQPVIRTPSDGSSPHCAVVDEYHLHDTSDQFDVFDTGMGSRDQPLLMVSTTAGKNMAAPCFDMEQDCIKQLDGVFVNDARFILIYTMDEDDDWRDFDTWRKVNPNIGVSISEKYLQQQWETAKRDATKQNDLRRKHCNEWVGSAKAWMNVLKWQRMAKPALFDEVFSRAPAHGHIDLASRKDVAAIALTFKNGNQYFTKQWFFVPELAVEENEKYQQYKNSGEIIVTPGSKTDQAFIEEKVRELHRQYDVRMWSFDDYQGDYIMTRLDNDGLPVVNYGSTVKNFSTPMKEMEALTIAGEMFNDGNACMTWMLGNVTCRVDEKDNIFPRKANKNDPRCKIDGPVAVIATLGTWLQSDNVGSLDDYLKSAGAQKA